MEGSASEMLVRSINAMVYMMNATGMMCVQRWEGIGLRGVVNSLTPGAISGIPAVKECAGGAGRSRGSYPSASHMFLRCPISSRQDTNNCRVYAMCGEMLPRRELLRTRKHHYRPWHNRGWRISADSPAFEPLPKPAWLFSALRPSGNPRLRPLCE